MRAKTREEQKFRKKSIIKGVSIVTIFAAVLIILSTTANAASAGFAAEDYKTGLSIVGAITITVYFMRLVIWLDTPRKKEGK